ncbi:MAG: hypothetical protein EHM13_00735 [Acidobacteria bacterium]|nr:MAG: hypothetical protein EHM13_00735 [Acidobacteriota bacterium]
MARSIPQGAFGRDAPRFTPVAKTYTVLALHSKAQGIQLGHEGTSVARRQRVPRNRFTSGTVTLFGSPGISHVIPEE